ncbi:uncharacterized protein BYT42DRAFT_609242 [Radiomyces spectabilis]|uniref:uncharacterized protein n=1 Tax=Radiomyces spectabilis TaxID=64574 RepID=UPI00221E96CB|nr:uncharacterized protein BYT42DRAFT_609242 [Radiomyces spectabilis]KAI8393448.1 hypothetical protein BYT42DRAFT_609242 [Radiomyces spectabilis]
MDSDSHHPNGGLGYTPNRRISFVGMKINQVKTELESQLQDKERLLGSIPTNGISKNALLKQTAEIRQTIQDLNALDEDDELPATSRNQLENLASEFQFVKTFPSKSGVARAQDVSQLLPPPPKTSTSSKLRTKPNRGPRRNTDIEFATEIGQGLLIEVRKLQAALQEKEERIKQLEVSDAEHERHHETTLKHLRQLEDAQEKLKEENWSLEVANQELRTNMSEVNQTVTKVNADYARATKQLTEVSEQLEMSKAQEEKAKTSLETLKARHEHDAQGLRRQAGALQRENTQLQKQLEALSTELKICQAKLAIKATATNRPLPVDKEPKLQEQESEPDNDTDASPSSSNGAHSVRFIQAMETETLRQSLGHAHRIISNLRSSLHKEKLEKFEIKKMLSDSQETIEQMRKKMSTWHSGYGNGRKKSGNKAEKNQRAKVLRKRGAIARQPKGLSEPGSAVSDKETDAYPADRLEEDDLFEEEDEEDQLDQDDDDDEDDDDEDEDDELDPHDWGSSPFTFNGLGNFSAPLSLSSELQHSSSPKSTVDVGVNTCTETSLNESLSTQLLHEENKENMIPITEAEALLKSAVEKAVKEERDGYASLHANMISKEESEALVASVQTALENERNEAKLRQAELISQAQVDILIQQAVDKAVNAERLRAADREADMISKAEAELKVTQVEKSMAQAMEQAVASLKEETAMREKEMIPKDAVDSLIKTAVNEALSKERMEAAVQQTYMITDIEATDVPPRPTENQEYQGPVKDTAADDMLSTHHVATDAEQPSPQPAATDARSTEALDAQIEDAVEKALAKEREAVAIAQATMMSKAEADAFIKQQVEEAVNREKEASLAREATMMRQSEAEALAQAQVEQSLANLRADMAKQVESMMAKDEVDRLINASVEEALAKERKEANQREMTLISRAQADELVRQSVEEVLAKEREATMVYQAQLMTKDQVDALVQESVNEALAKEREATTMYQAQLMTKDQVDALVQESVNEALAKERQEVAAREANMISKEEADALAKAYAAEQQLSARDRADHLDTLSVHNQSSYQQSPQINEPPIVSTFLSEKSTSVSRLAKLSGLVKLHPSASTPANGQRTLRPSSSISSLRSESGRKSVSNANEAPSYGTVRIVEQRTLAPVRPTPSRSDSFARFGSMRSLHKQTTSTSGSTNSSLDDTTAIYLPSSAAGFLAQNTQGTDTEVISAITQTMIGEWMFKHTRRHVGGGISENKHKRFFWVHPYTRTLYWSATEPGVDSNEAKAKSAFIDSLSVVASNDTTGASPLSLLIKTTKRELKLTASDIDRHELWLLSLSYLVMRPETEGSESVKQEGSIKPYLHEQSSLSTGIHSYNGYDSEDSEDLIDIRQCCDGKHDLTTLSRDHKHHHHH